VEVHPVLTIGERSYEASYAPVVDEQQGLRGVVMVARDVTERIAAQRTRLSEQRMAVVGKLAAGLAHELNNPLGAIVLFAQDALGSVPQDHPLALHLGTVLRNAKLCKKTVRDLLEYARQRPPERRTVAVEELLDDVVRTLSQRAAAARVTLGRETAPGAPPSLQGDPDQLLQVLVNLGLNGIEALEHGGQVTFRCAAAPEGWLCLEVSDTGPGIAAGDLERIFTEFHTTKPEGTGLGLTVAKDLVVAHGGTLEARSTPGAGATFSLRLPVGERGAALREAS
jgi:signal transduction histidine kinase